MADWLAGGKSILKMLCYLKSFCIHHIEIYSEMKHQYANGCEMDREKGRHPGTTKGMKEFYI